MPVLCVREKCGKTAVLKRPKTGDPMCKECFFFAFETEIHVTIVEGGLFTRGDRVAIGASGGKDSTVLAYVLKLLNERYDYDLDLFLLSIDEGITGYRDDSLETVKQNRDDYQLPLKILSYKDLYGWTMDEIVAQIGKKNNCTFCGVFRRQALDRGAAIVGADMIVTGHNADDTAETVIMNILRGDLARLARCTNIITEGEGTIPRCKPLKYAYEKEIVMYAHYKQLVYFSTECIYAPNAYRGLTREYIKEIERVRPTCILDIIHSGETIQVKSTVKLPQRQKCTRCGFVASQEICKACVLLEGLNIGVPKLGIGKSNKAKRMMGLHVPDGSENKSKKKEVDLEKRESKRKMRRENKKKSTCGESCSSSCRSENRQKSTEDVDMSESFLLSNPEDEEGACGTSIDSSEPSKSICQSGNCEDGETTCGASVDCSVPPTSELISSEDEESIVEIKEKKERIVCRCHPRFRANPNEIQSRNTDDSNDSSDDDGTFNVELFKYLVLKDQPEMLEKTMKPSSYAKLQSANVSKKSEAQPSLSASMEDDHPQSLSEHLSNITKLSSLTMKETIDQELKTQLSVQLNNTNDPPVTVKESAHPESSSTACSNNADELLDGQPTVVKATPKRIGPSLMLPEMMHKAKNNLEF